MSTLPVPAPAPSVPALPPALIGITGPSGSGKSSSLQHLDLTLWRIHDIEAKGMPFRVPSTSAGSISTPSSVDEWKAQFNAQVKDPSVFGIAIDSITSLIDMLQTECESHYKGFDIWKYYNDGIGDILRRMNTAKKPVIITSLDEVVILTGLDGQPSSQRRMFVQGKEWASKGLESQCLAVWSSFAKRKPGPSGEMDYFFATQTDGITRAKSPMFWKLPAAMPNNVKLALDTIAKNLV